MKYRLLLLSTVTIALAAGAGWYIYQTLYPNPSASPATAQTAPQPAVQTVNGETVVVLAPEVQRASHIEVSPLAATAVRPARSAYATVIDLQPLLDLRGRLAAARADLDTMTAQAGNSHVQYERSRVLFEDDRNVSQKSLQDARAAMQGDQAKLQSATATVSGLTATMRQQFGDALTDAATTPASGLFQRLLSGRGAVLRVTLPADDRDPAPARITINAPGGEAVPTQKLSASPLADPSVQGNPWFYAADRALPVGTHTSVDLPSADPVTSALAIPERAVIWYGGEAWAYVQTAPDRFTRRYVAAGNESDQGFIVTTGFHAGDRIVTQGAQLLLSEELKPQGIATACKDPPECDD
ncbi:metal transporter [Paraburkholderia sp. UYCP14C]|uniref:efflux RND transporter periplasmic adaptor subunit n=1 Tax=Paraburkholderia sp. UYCP14C TaxID=2511130 RepID=UPI0010218717|nr:metal transporter [Paraburkholderia sp. UYCP14C]RZF24989.1 metal transporter [Paraburkholderia sp. UYCP14C]